MRIAKFTASLRSEIRTIESVGLNPIRKGMAVNRSCGEVKVVMDGAWELDEIKNMETANFVDNQGL